jgi:HAL2 family 3'(2'),5'-bisphosphate nucleotidase
MNTPFEREQEAAVAAVRQAAKLCRSVAAGIRPDVVDKKDKSPVTVADYGSQAAVCRALGTAFPNDPIVAEEDSEELRNPTNAAILDQVVQHVQALGMDGLQTATEICEWIDRGGTRGVPGRFWTLDPIDGTKGFLRREQYAVALALIVDGQVAVAALACPNLPLEPGIEGGEIGSIFTAVRGQGAFVLPLAGDFDTGGGKTLRPIRVSPRADPATARFCESVESGHSAHGDSAAIAARLGITEPPARLDSQAKYGVVARGEAEIYLRMPTRADYREKIWDHAAGVLIVEEAGGTATDIAGRPLEFHHGRELSANRGVIVTNGRLHAQLLETLQSLGLG